MFDDFLILMNTMVGWFMMIWNAVGTWGVLGAFIIGMPILRKICILLKNLWKGGI